MLLIDVYINFSQTLYTPWACTTWSSASNFKYACWHSYVIL